MRILIHDYGGYSFTVQLARELARRGHDIYYLFGDSVQAMKRGPLEHHQTDLEKFRIRGLSLSNKFQKYSLVKRRLQEKEYGQLLVSMYKQFLPEIVISANTPLDAQSILIQSCTTNHSKFIFWFQDAIGLATYRIMDKRYGFFGRLIGYYYIQKECELLRKSNAIVLISEDFQPLMIKWGIEEDKVHLIHNWAPIDEFPPLPKNNPWAQEHGYADKFCFLYAGVLGYKHNPELIRDLAHYWQNVDNVRIVVVSEGPGANRLKKEQMKDRLDNLVVLNFQPFEQFPYVLASADVLFAILDECSGAFSVPSKILSYLCVKRPLLLAIPKENLSARIVLEVEAGIVVSPDDPKTFVLSAQALFDNPQQREIYAHHAFEYASEHFRIHSITDKFEAIFKNLD